MLSQLRHISLAWCYVRSFMILWLLIMRLELNMIITLIEKAQYIWVEVNCGTIIMNKRNSLSTQTISLLLPHFRNVKDDDSHIMREKKWKRNHKENSFSFFFYIYIDQEICVYAWMYEKVCSKVRFCTISRKS